MGSQSNAGILNECHHTTNFMLNENTRKRSASHRHSEALDAHVVYRRESLDVERVVKALI